MFLEKRSEKKKLGKRLAAGEERVRKWLHRRTSFSLWLLWGYILGNGIMLFDTRPLGLALLCGTSGNVVAVLSGCVLSALLRPSERLIYLCTYLVVGLVRVLVDALSEHPDMRVQWRLRMANRQSDASTVEEPQARGGTRGLFTQSVVLRMCIGALGGLMISLYRAIVGGFVYYDLFASLFFVAVTPAAVLLYHAATDDRLDMPALQKIAQGGWLFSIVWASNGASVFSISFSLLLCLFFSLYLAVKRNVPEGAVGAVLCGMAYHPLYAPAFLAAGLIYGFLQRRKRENAGLLLGLFAVLAWSVYVDGAGALGMMLPACLLAGASVQLVLKIAQWNAPKPIDAALDPQALREQQGRMHVEMEKYKDSSNRFRSISEAFSSLSEMLYNLSDRFRRPGTLDLRQICDSSFEGFCKECPNKSVCWGLEYGETLAQINALISQLHLKGRVCVHREENHSALFARCDAMPQILEEINRECARLTGNLLRNNRTEIFAMDYESAANIINDALEEDNDEYCLDAELEQRVAVYLKDAGVSFDGIAVYGKRQKQIHVQHAELSASRVTAETLRTDLGEMCGVSFERPLFEVEDGSSTMLLRAKQKISISVAKNNISAEGGVCGDTVNLFSNRKGYFYSLISDGMGCGREAALTSSLCSVFLEEMLRGGNRASTSLKMLNNMLRSRGTDSTRECASTVDLMELDLMTAKASFIKSGAAPSFIVRKDTVHRLQTGSVPIGILGQIEAPKTEFSLLEGDTVVMVSDGILQEEEDEKWLDSFLSNASALSPEEIVYRICMHAAEDVHHDDCSAVAVRISLCEESGEAEDAEEIA